MSKLKASWLHVSLEVDPELAEAMAEVLGRYAPGGVAIESTQVEADAEDQGSAVGRVRVSGYIPVDAEIEETRQRLEHALRSLALIEPMPQLTFEFIQEQNWMEAWKQHYRPLRVGKRLLVLPAWIDMDTEERLPVRIEPGMAFGTGVHPSTQLGLRLLEACVRPGLSFVDVGCGSGILSIAAARLGAGPILGVDTDAKAIENARHNAALNQMELRFEQGSVEEIRNGEFGLAQADVVAANILAPILVRLLDEGLGELVGREGALVLSGILEEQLGELLAALARAGMRVERQRNMEDWVALLTRAS